MFVDFNIINSYTDVLELKTANEQGTFFSISNHKILGNWSDQEEILPIYRNIHSFKLIQKSLKTPFFI